ncbi:MAG: hypothetical protein V1704_03460 [Candidatus Vogelbacteria bacterium]
MATLSIPQGLIKEGFVVLPRREYEDLLRTKQNNNIVVKRDDSFKVPKRHEKFYDELDKELTESLREYKAGNFVGPFDNVKDLLISLHSKK